MTTDYKNIIVEKDNGITWVMFNRPEKRNAMSPQLHHEMDDALMRLAIDDETKVLIITGKGDAFSAGQDLKLYFRETESDPVAKQRAQQAANSWRWHRITSFPKPTIAMVNGWCFGGAFTPLICCDLAIASEDAVFGLSEINWGVIPGGVVSKAISTLMNDRKAMYYVMTGEKFGGKMAEQLGLVNEAVPADKLRERTVEIARVLLEKNPTVLRQARMAYKYVREMTWEESAEYLTAKADQTTFVDPEKGREKGLSQFLDTKTYRPGHGAYKREG